MTIIPVNVIIYIIRVKRSCSINSRTALREDTKLMSEKRKKLTPVNNESVVQQVINKITDAIISGELNPGDKLPPELELVETLRVSRNSLRSAIQTLRAYGVLEVRRPEGTFVCSNISPQMLNPMLYSIILHERDAYKDLTGLRQIIDTGISKLIIKNGLSDEEIKILEERYDGLVALLMAEDYDIQAITDADLYFHEAVAEATHNSLAVMLNDFLLNITSESRYRTIKTVFEANDREYLMKAHRMHLDALEKKPGVDIEEALEFSYFYWKNSLNW